MRGDLGTWRWDEGKVSTSFFSNFKYAKFRRLDFFFKEGIV